jgi:excisionase family DNA binding protein
MSSYSTALSDAERKAGGDGQRSSVLGPEWDGFSVFTVEEAGCKILRLSRESAYAAAGKGDLPTIRVGRRLLVPRAALERLLGNTRAAAE